jgi:processive 1,2-diacylglycerol beta-glucosyltransferase
LHSLRILVLTAGFGEGHNAAARAVGAALRAHGAEALVEDLYPVAYGRLNEIARRGYIGLINRAPKLWAGIYGWIHRGGWRRATGPGTGPLRRVLADRLATFRPDVIVSTFPAYNYLMDEVADPPPRVTVITDSVSVNAIWVRCRPHPWVVPNAATAGSVYELGVEPHWVHALGFPVAPVFYQGERRQRPAPRDGVKPRVLYIINSGRKLAPTIGQRLLSRRDWRVTIAVGRDEALRARLSKLAAEDSEILGWTDRIPQLLMEHHVVISKAGGATTQEAVAALTPMIVNQIVPGQEEGNYQLLRGVGSGAYAETPDEIERALDQAFADGGRLWEQWRDRLRPISHPEAADKVARFVLSQARVHAGPAGCMRT